MPVAKKKSVVKVESIDTEPEPPPIMTEEEPTNREVINYVNNTMLQIITCMEQKKNETIEEFKKLLEANKPAPLPPAPILSASTPEPDRKPWYKNWFAWVLSVIVLALIGYGIYILIMVESGKRIVIPWVH